MSPWPTWEAVCIVAVGPAGYLAAALAGRLIARHRRRQHLRRLGAAVREALS